MEKLFQICTFLLHASAIFTLSNVIICTYTCVFLLKSECLGFSTPSELMCVSCQAMTVAAEVCFVMTGAFLGIYSPVSLSSFCIILCIMYHYWCRVMDDLSTFTFCVITKYGEGNDSYGSRFSNFQIYAKVNFNCWKQRNYMS